MTKRDVEGLLERYDSDPVGALTVALRVVLQRPDADWAALIAAAAFHPDRQAALASNDQQALDQLVRELNELRTLA